MRKTRGIPDILYERLSLHNYGKDAVEDQTDVEVSWQTTAFFVCGSGAYVLYLAWFFSIFTQSGALAGLESGTGRSYVLQIGFVGMLLAALGAAWAFSDSLSTRKGLFSLAVTGAVLSPIATGVSLVDVGYGVLVCGWCLSGVGCACIMMLVAAYLSTLTHRDVLLCTSTSFALALILFLLVSFLSPEVMKAATLSVLPMASAILFLYVHFRYLLCNVPSVTVSESRARNPMSWKSIGAACGHSMCLGFAVYCTVVITAGFSIWVPVIAGFAVFFASVFMALDGYVGKEWLNSEGMQLKLFLPFAAIGLLPMPFLDARGQTACCCVLFLVFIPQAITNINAVAENVRLYELSPIRSFAGARVANISGLLIGYSMGFIAYGHGLGQGMVNSLMVLLVLLFVLIVLAAFLFQDRYPSKSVLSIDGDDGLEHSTGWLSWKARCNLFAKEIGLSPRQTEVLVLLSRGYNTKYIEERLVISNHTAKSHIYHIYQKADVHSKQEIIEMIEHIGPEG